VVYMYMRDPPEGATPVNVGGATQAGLGLAAAFTIAIGLIPPVTIAVIGVAEEAARALL
jgi:NADH:ubiquinone oxidoreductase subunit 2 (subunit N)